MESVNQKTSRRATSADTKKFVEFKKILQKYLNTYQIKKVEKAFSFAQEAHEGQKRESGEAFIQHPLSAASYLADYQLDYESIMAAILHDVIEDTETNKKKLSKEFGEKVSDLVDGVSKLDKINFSTKEEADAANLRKMILAMSQDIRVILIKLADRRHNLKTAKALSYERRRKIGKETLDIFAPIALRLGIHNMKVEMEDLAFESIHPIRYRVLKDKINKSRGNRKGIMKKIQKEIETKLSEEGLKSNVIAREKHVYGIYKKMQQKELKFSQIYDLFGVRIITDSVDDCYRTLGVIHNLYTPMPGKFKDYIAIPKSNGYQSLHTTIFGPHGLPLEFQIRTDQMDFLAQTGIAAHWFYKSKGSSSMKDYTKEQQWITNLLNIQQNSGDPIGYLKSIKSDLRPGKVYVFTHKGDILELPKRSTVIDFAYAVHTDLGNTFSSAQIDGQIALPNTILKNGQKVQIFTDKKTKPNPNWLNFVITEKARHSVRAALKLTQKEDATALGKKLLNHSLVDFGIELSEIPVKTLKLVLQEYGCNNIDELYSEIGLGNRIPKIVAMRIAPINPTKSISQKKLKGIHVQGTEGLVLSYAKCCYPIPGDSIIGHISPGKGIVIHRQSCMGIRHIKRANEQNIDLMWSENIDDLFNSCIKVEVENKRGVLAEISSVIAKNECNIDSVTYDDTKETGHNIMVFVISIRNLKSLTKLMSQLRKNINVLNVIRKQS